MKAHEPKIRNEFSPNRDTRPDGVMIDTIVLHSTVLNTLEDVVKHFASTDTQVSCHYTIGKDGTIVRHVPDEEKAWHAGASRMPDGRERANDFSIGIEIVNLNDGEDPYTEAQYRAINELIEYLAEKHPIKHLVGHVEIAHPPGRKSDPKNFDYGKLGKVAKKLRPKR